MLCRLQQCRKWIATLAVSNAYNGTLNVLQLEFLSTETHVLKFVPKFWLLPNPVLVWGHKPVHNFDYHSTYPRCVSHTLSISTPSLWGHPLKNHAVVDHSPRGDNTLLAFNFWRVLTIGLTLIIMWSCTGVNFHSLWHYYSIIYINIAQLLWQMQLLFCLCFNSYKRTVVPI